MADRSSSRSSSWPWRKIKNSSKLSSAATSSDQHHDKDDNCISASTGSILPKGSMDVVNGDQLAMALSSATSSLAQELAAARDEIAVKEASVKQHQKVAEDAIAGWEKAEAEAQSYKVELEASKQQRGIMEERVAQLEAALKECTRQVRQVREENAAKMEEAMAAKSRELERLQAEMEQRQAELHGRLMECQAQNSAMAKSLQERARKISEANDARAMAETQAKLLEVRLASYEKEISSLKYEVHVSTKELEIRNEEVEFVKRSADAAHKQHLDNVKKMANLEADVNRLRNLLKKKLPGPAAIAQMRKEVEGLRIVDNPMTTDPKRRSGTGLVRSPYHNHGHVNGSTSSSTTSPRSLASSSMYSTSPGRQNGHSGTGPGPGDLDMLRDRMLWMEEENNLLKETLSKRNEELQAARLLSAKMAGKLSVAEDQLETLGRSSSSSMNGNGVKVPDNTVHMSDGPTTSSDGRSVSVDHHPLQERSNGHGVPDGDGDDDDDDDDGDAQEVSCAESWASALMSELAHFKKEKSIPNIANPNASSSVEITNDQPTPKIYSDRLNVSSNSNADELRDQIDANPNPIAVKDPQSHLNESESLNTILENHSDSCNGGELVVDEKQSIPTIHGDTAAYISLLNTLCQDLGRKLGAIEEHLKPSVAISESQMLSREDDVGVRINNDNDESRSMKQEEAAAEDSEEVTDNRNHNSNGDMGGSNDALLQAMVDDAHKKFAELEKEIYALAGIHSHSHSHSHSDGDGDGDGKKTISKESEILELNDIIHELRGELDKAKADVALLVDTKAQVEGDMEAARAEVAAARADVDGLKADVASREGEIENARAELASASAEAAKLRVDVATLTAELAEQKKAYDDVAARCEELEQKLAAMQSSDDSNGSNGEDPDSRKERELVAAKEKLGECQRTIVALGKQLTALSSPPGCHSPGGSFDTATSSMDSASLLAAAAGHPYSNQHHPNNTYLNMEEPNPQSSARYHHNMNRRYGPPLTPSRISSANWSHNGTVPRGGGGALYDVDDPAPPRSGFPRYAMSGPQGTPPPSFIDQHHHAYEQQQAMRMSGQVYMGPSPQFYTNSNRYNGAGWVPPGDSPLDDMDTDGHPLALTLYQSPHQQSSVMSPAKSPARYYDQLNGTGRNVAVDMAFHPTNTTTTTTTTTKEPSPSGSGLSRLFKSKKKH